MTKCLQNYSYKELKEALPNVPYYKIDLVYKYCQKPRNITVQAFAMTHGVSTATLYRYVTEIKRLLKIT